MDHANSLTWLSAIRLPHHIQSDQRAQQLRNQKYVIQMSQPGFDLFVGWLSEGVGGEAAGSGDGFLGEQGKRGRAAVMRVVNNHLDFNGDLSSLWTEKYCLFTKSIVASTTAATTNVTWEESTGLMSSLIPQIAGTSTAKDPQAFNASKGELKLGPLPILEDLRAETEKALRAQAMMNRTDLSAQADPLNVRPIAPPGIISPQLADLPPHPPTFKTIDIEREVERVVDARKRIKLGSISPATDSAAAHGSTTQPALPSICAYTLHDVPEGWV
jgi:transcription initiation factor TFIID subunit 5